MRLGRWLRRLLVLPLLTTKAAAGFGQFLKEEHPWISEHQAMTLERDLRRFLAIQAKGRSSR